jgi:pimeloyl-ACP methyl ester carboxylesterase
MLRTSRFALGLCLLGLPASGCTCGDSPKPPAPASTASALASAPASAPAPIPERPRRPTQPAPKPESFSATTPDGVRIEASRWVAKEPSTTVVILVHRLGGDRSEWTPLVERLLPTKQPMHLVSFDLRGHGASTADPKKPKGKIGWQSFEPADFGKMDADLEAVMAKHTKGAASWILVGSDLGATLVVRQAASREGDVVGVALVSPGAALRGIDLYKPFAHVLRHPNLLLAGTRDTVSDGTVKLLSRMSPTSKLVTWDARGHGAQFLGEERWEMWDELADWVDERVRETLVGTAVPASSASASASGSAPVSMPPAPSASARGEAAGP